MKAVGYIDGDELDYLYHLLKDEPLTEKIAFPLFSNELFVWSQRDFFQQYERQILLNLAWNEAKMLVLPLVGGIPIKELALEYLTRYVVFLVFNNSKIRSELLTHYRKTYYPSPLKEVYKVYNSLVYLLWQDRICQRYHNALIERLCSHPVAKHTFVLAAQNKEAYFGITSSADAVLASQKSFQFLLKRYLNQINFRLPTDEKESLINNFLGKWIAKLRNLPFEKLCHEVFFTDRVIKSAFIDEWRGERGRYPEGGCEYFDADIVSQSGRKVSALEVLEGNHQALQTVLTVSQKEALREFLSNTELEILECFYEHPDFTQKEVAGHVGCTQSKVSKARRKFKRFEKEIKKILEI